MKKYFIYISLIFICCYTSLKGQEVDIKQDYKYYIKGELGKSIFDGRLLSIEGGYRIPKSNWFVLAGIGFNTTFDEREKLITIDTMNNEYTGRTYRFRHLSNIRPYIGFGTTRLLNRRHVFSASVTLFYDKRDIEVALVDEQDIFIDGGPIFYSGPGVIAEPIGDPVIDKKYGYGSTLRLHYEIPIESYCHLFVGLNMSVAFYEVNDYRPSGRLLYDAEREIESYVPGDFSYALSIGATKYITSINDLKPKSSL